MAGPKAIAFEFPVRGKVTATSYRKQPAGTTPDCLNVIPYSIDGNGTQARGRGGQRWGVSRLYPAAVAIGAGGDVQLVRQAVIPGSTETSGRETKLIAVENGSVYSGTMDTAPTLATGGSAQLSQARKPQMAVFQTKAYFVDGRDNPPRVLNLSTAAMTTWTNTAGTVPQGCELATLWRGRLVLGRQAGFEQNFYMSRVGDPHDWNYDATDSVRAVAGNATATFGQLGQPLMAMATWTDDQLLLFCDHSIHVMSGDPAAGGTLDLLSSAIGCIGPDAWCYTPDGSIFFVGPGGLYLLPGGGGAPVPVSQDKANDWFAAIDRGTEWVMLEYDVENYQVHVYRTRVDPGQFVDHMVFDVRTKGFFPIRYPSATIGPASVCVFDGDAPGDRVVLYGGRNGRIYKADRGGYSDDGESIYSYAICGPIRLMDDLNEGKVHAIDFYTGHDDPALTYAMNWIVKLGTDHQDVAEAAAGTAPVEITGNANLRGRNPKQRIRGRGGSCALVLWSDATDSTWSLERAVMEVHPAGRGR